VLDFLWTSAFFHRVLLRKGPWSQEWGARHKGVMNCRLSVASMGYHPGSEVGNPVGLALALTEKKSAHLLPLRRLFIQQ